MIKQPKIYRNTLCALLQAAAITIANAQTWSNLTELSSTNPAHSEKLNNTDENPIRGFIPGGYGHDNQFKYSVERRYVDFDLAFNSEQETLNKSAIDNEINKTTNEGAHLVIRVICYYPGDNPFKFFKAPREVINGKEQIKWNDPGTMGKLISFIEQFGAAYKDDERIVMVELGLYGNWGEWNVDNNVPEMTIANRRALVSKYQEAFNRGNGKQTKFLGIRYVTALSGNTHGVDSVMDPILANMGIYDDSFSYQTIGNANDRINNTYATWNTAQAIFNSKTTDTYKNAPRAGEPRPETMNGWPNNNVQQYFGLLQQWPNHSKDTSYNYNGIGTRYGIDEDFAKSVQAIRLSWLGVHGVFLNGFPQGQRDNALKAVKLLGYQLVVPQTFVQRNGTNGADVGVKIKNNGVAPFYFNWDVEFKAVTSSGETNLGFTKTNGNSWNLKDVSAKEGNIVTEKTFTGALTGLPSTACHIIMRFKNPLESHTSKARALRFLNFEQDTAKVGWLTLGALAASNSAPQTILLPNGKYTIQRYIGNEFLTAVSAWNPITFSANSGANTKWRIVNLATPNHIAIVADSSVHSGTMLEVPENSIAAWTQVKLSGDAWNRPHSTWKVEKVTRDGPDPYRFIPILNLNLSMDAYHNGTQGIVHLYGKEVDNTNQMFKVLITN